MDLIKDLKAPLILAAWDVYQRPLQGRVCNAIVDNLRVPIPRLL
jgi:hypothetical protein